jgi:GntR family transcriptional regulator
MRHLLAINPSDPTPIWSQIVGRLRWMVASERLLPGEPVPSVRELARQLGLNPATVARAYTALVDEGVLEVRRGAGTFVAERPPQVRDATLGQQLREAARRYAAEAWAAGSDEEQAVQALQAAWATMQPDRARGGA